MAVQYFDVHVIDGDTLYECSVCASLVAAEGTSSHSRWHDTLKLYLVGGKQ